MNTLSLVLVNPETRKTVKQQVICLHKKGMTGRAIAEMLNFSEYAVSRIVRSYKKEGMNCVKEKTRGRKQGEKRTLTPQQEKEIQRSIIDKHSEQMKLAFCLWIRK